MTAFYRSGRQAEALEVYQDARHALVDELGIEPGPELHELERAILRHDRRSSASRRPRAARSGRFSWRWTTTAY
jgi:DNA-binding SARP family transcriptional activator